MTLPVDYIQLVDWLANEHKVLSQALRREPTNEEHRVHAHAFVDLVFDDQAKAGAAWAAAATKIVRFVPPVRPRESMDTGAAGRSMGASPNCSELRCCGALAY
jgi:hypothetical protein